MKAKYIILIIVSVLLLGCACLWWWIMGTSSTGPVSKKEFGPMDVMPLGGLPLSMELVPGLKMKFDTGADISSISKKDLEKLKELGYEPRIINRPIAGRDGYGDYVFYTKRALINLPIGGYTITTDSLGKKVMTYTGKPSNELIDVEFALTDNDYSSLGLSLLNKFKQEFIYLPGAVAFHNSVPDGYQHVADIQTNTKLFDFFWRADRPYMILSVNQRPNIYLLDTGLQRVQVKLPSRDEFRASNTLRPDSFHTMTNVYPARVDDEAWIELGNRAGAKMACYYDNNEDDYQYNPLNLYTQDILLDLQGHAMYFRPTSETEIQK